MDMGNACSQIEVRKEGPDASRDGKVNVLWRLPQGGMRGLQAWPDARTRQPDLEPGKKAPPARAPPGEKRGVRLPSRIFAPLCFRLRRGRVDNRKFSPPEGGGRERRELNADLAHRFLRGHMYLCSTMYLQVRLTRTLRGGSFSDAVGPFATWWP